ncbi:MAG TPA: protein-disulfide reductase DsbD domain-containing protein [bacterium]|nr:protein-disulfide reductase DsbD domain-containing protein [bacterium]
MPFRLGLGLFLFLLAGLARASAVAHQPHIVLELVSQTSTLRPGQAVTLGFHYQIEPGWHLYWQNPGDSGLAPSFTFTLPEGYSAGPVLWPRPQRLASPGLVDYGYRNDALFMVPIQVPANAHPGELVTFSAMARWLVCDEICIPGRAALELKLVVKKKVPGPSKNAKLFTLAAQALPKPWPGGWKAQGTLDAKAFHLAFATPDKPTQALFFPLHPNQIDNAAPQEYRFSSHVVHLDLKRSDQLVSGVQTLEGLLVLKSKKGSKSYSISLPLSSR